MSYSLIETFKRIVSEANRFNRVDFGGYDIYMQTNDGRTITATIRFDGGGQDQNEAYLLLESSTGHSRMTTLTLHQFEHLSSYTAHSERIQALVSTSA